MCKWQQKECRTAAATKSTATATMAEVISAAPSTTTASAGAATAVTYVWMLQSIVLSIFKSIFPNKIGKAIFNIIRIKFMELFPVPKIWK